ncbi:hypothetical protein ACIMS1_004497 [Vibrio harveyi]
MGKAIFNSYNGIQVNYCVSTECENFGKGDSEYYREVINNYDMQIYFCPKCGSYPQIINNRLIFEATKYQEQVHEIKIISCTNVRCLNHKHAVHSYREKYNAFGKTRTLKQRYQCKECGNIFTDKFSGINSFIEIQSGLFYGMKYFSGIRALCESENIYPKSFYKHQKEMVERLRYLAYIKEESFYKKTDRCLVVTDYCFIGDTLGTILIASVHNETGYIIGFDTNLSKDMDKSCFFNIKQKNKPINNAIKDNLALNILTGYEEIMSRSNYLDPTSNDLRGTPTFINLSQPYLCSFAHALRIHKKLSNKLNRYYFTSQDTMLRNSFINASLNELINGEDQLFYYKEGNKNIEGFSSSTFSIRRIGWWKDKWGFVSDGRMTKASCHIKGNNLTNDKWSQLTLDCSLDDVTRYLQLSSIFISKLIPTVHHQSVNDWLNIFTIYYNYCIPNKDGKTPAQLMGFFDRPMGLSELLSGKYYK